MIAWTRVRFFIDDQRITRRLSNKLDEIRNLRIGYIFQNYNLIEDATVFENVCTSSKDDWL